MVSFFFLLLDEFVEFCWRFLTTFTKQFLRNCSFENVSLSEILNFRWIRFFSHDWIELKKLKFILIVLLLPSKLAYQLFLCLFFPWYIIEKIWCIIWRIILLWVLNIAFRMRSNEKTCCQTRLRPKYSTCCKMYTIDVRTEVKMGRFLKFGVRIL